MKCHKSIGPMLRNEELKFWTPINLKSNIFSTRKLKVF